MHSTCRRASLERQLSRGQPACVEARAPLAGAAYDTVGRAEGARDAVQLITEALDVIARISNDDVPLVQRSLHGGLQGAP